MKENKQVTLLIGVGLFFCVLILGYSAFFAQPIQIYNVLPASAEASSEATAPEWETEETSFPEEIDEATSGVVNINTAGLLELMKLEGVGEVTAKKIMAYREENGGFSDVRELLNVEGIGAKKYEALEPHIIIE